MFYVNTCISYLTKQSQIGISEVDLAYRNVSFGPMDLATSKNSEVSQETIDFWCLFFFFKRAGNRSHLHMKTTISWKGLENDTEILVLEYLAQKHLQSNIFSFPIKMKTLTASLPQETIPYSLRCVQQGNRAHV